MVWAAMASGCAGFALGQEGGGRERVIEETLKPYEGAVKKGVDASTINRKILAGYQGWFTNLK